MHLNNEGAQPRLLIQDRDSKFTRGFDEVNINSLLLRRPPGAFLFATPLSCFTRARV